MITPDDFAGRFPDDETLIREFGVKPFNIIQARAYMAGLRAVDLKRNPPDASVVARWTPIFAWRHRAVPVTVREDRGGPVLYVAVGPNTDREMIGRSLQECHEEKIELVLALDDHIEEALTRLYGPDPDAAAGSPGD